MEKYEYLKDFGTRKKGDVVEMYTSTAKGLINAKVLKKFGAEEKKESKPKKDK